MSIALDGDVSFEVATDAHGIATIGTETDGVHDAGLSIGRDVLAGVPVAGFAGDATVKKGQTLITIDRARIAGLNRAHVTSQASTLHGKRRRDVIDVRESGLYVVTA